MYITRHLSRHKQTAPPREPEGLQHHEKAQSYEDILKAMEAIRPRITERQIIEAEREWREAIQPIVRLRAKVFSCVMPVYVARDGSFAGAVYSFTPEEQKLLDMYDQMIKDMMPKVLRQAMEMAKQRHAEDATSTKYVPVQTEGYHSGVEWFF